MLSHVLPLVLSIVHPRRALQTGFKADGTYCTENEGTPAALDQVLCDASSGSIVIIPRLLLAFKAALGKSLNLSTLYRILVRHGWRKLALDIVHPQGNPEQREDFKKNSSSTWRKL